MLDERHWARPAGYATLDFHQSLQVFGLRRAELVCVLRGLPPEAWTRATIVDGRSHSVFSQVRRMALHEAEHWAQMEALFKG